MPELDLKKTAIIVALPGETQKSFAGVEIHYCGIGKVNAAFKATEVILKTGCTHIVNLGTAGSYTFPTHSLIECSQVVQRDMDITPLGVPLGNTPMDEIPGTLDCQTFFSHMKKGICGTGDKFETTPPALKCDLVDMEAYAIAKVCKKLGVGFSAYKYITDGSDDNAHKDWMENLKPAAKALRQVFDQLFKDGQS